MCPTPVPTPFGWSFSLHETTTVVTLRHWWGSVVPRWPLLSRTPLDSDILSRRTVLDPVNHLLWFTVTVECRVVPPLVPSLMGLYQVPPTGGPQFCHPTPVPPSLPFNGRIKNQTNKKKKPAYSVDTYVNFFGYSLYSTNFLRILKKYKSQECRHI